MLPWRISRVLGVFAGVVACAPSSPASIPDTGTTTSTTTSHDSTTIADTSGTPTTGTGELETSATSTSTGVAPADSTGDPIVVDLGVDLPPVDPFDCDALPQGPLPYTLKRGLPSGEDFAFDHLGNFVGTDLGNLVRTPYDGAPVLWVAGANAYTGLRATSEGIFVFARQDTLSRIDADDQLQVVLAGLSYPNAIEVDDDGFVYVAEMAAGRVRRIDPHTGDFSVMGEGFSAPNGLSFDTTYSRLYVSSNLEGDVHVIELDGAMAPLGPPTLFAQPGTTNITGLGVDACDNVYVIDLEASAVWRVRPEDGEIDAIVESVGNVALSNLQWGSGVGGWERETLYVLDLYADQVLEIPVGVPSKPRAYP